MKHIWSLLIITLLQGVFLTAYGQTILERKVANSSAVENNVFSLAYDNPALKSLWHSTSLTEINIGGEYKKEDEASVIQEGDGFKMGKIDVSSYIRKENKSLWGQAYYKNGKKLGRCWNETSDFLLLYPYVMGDTLGGDLKSEEYYFSGGYAYNKSRFSIGLEGSYKAGIEYRNADPRPKNLTGDLKARLGISYDLNTSYILGATVYARKYKQTNDLAFYNELGVPNIFHFTGLGTDYYRFRGSKGESFYKGRAFGGSLEMLPVKYGMSAAIQYHNFQFDKVISTLNELPMSRVVEDNIKGEMAWKSKFRTGFVWGLRGNLYYTRRIGAENLFSAATGNIFTQIASQKRFMNKIYNSQLVGVLEYNTISGIRTSILPQLAYTNIHTRYNLPHRDMRVALLHHSVDLRLDYPLNKWLFSGETGITYKFRIHSKIDILKGQKTEEPIMSSPIRSNFEALKANNSGFHIHLRADYTWNQKYSVYLATKYQYEERFNSKLQYITGNLGFSF